MLSAKDIAAVKVAVELCNGPVLKEEILKLDVVDAIYNINSDNKKLWDDNMEKKSSAVLEKIGLGSLGLGKCLQENVIGYVLLIGARMLTWATFHESKLGFSRGFSVSILKSSLFTSRGIIDTKRAAEEMMKCQSLNVKQRYKLSCLYCFVNQIPILFSQMTKEDQIDFYDDALEPIRIERPTLIKFWSYYLVGQIDKLVGDKNIDEYMLDIAIESGSKATVKYCLEKTDNDITLMDAALMLVKKKARPNQHLLYQDIQALWDSIWSLCFKHKIESTVTTDCFIDILCSLLDRMTVTQQIEFLSNHIGENELRHKEPVVCRFLKHFLNWPYQNYFLKTVNLTWKFLPKRTFESLLSDVFSKIYNESEIRTLQYGEGKVYNYRTLLNKFWCESPQSFRSYIFNSRDSRELGPIIDCMLKLFSFENFSNEDLRNIKMILESATDVEKRRILYSDEANKMGIKVMKEENWIRLDQFISIFCSSPEEEKKFKREFSFSEKAKKVCREFVSNDSINKEKYDSADSFIRWSALSEEEIIKLKREMFYSVKTRDASNRLFPVTAGTESANVSCNGVISSELEQIFYDLILRNKYKMVEKLIRWCIFSEEEIKLFKKNFAYKRGRDICYELISENEYLTVQMLHENYCENASKPLWEHIEMFITWLFSSEKEIHCFKRNALFKDAVDIIFKLIKKYRFEEAEKFIAWLDLTSKEVRDFKKTTLLSNMEEIFKLKDDVLKNYFSYAGDKGKKIELILRWCLIDQEAVLEFKEIFDCKYGFKSYNKHARETSEEERIEINCFYYSIDELLKEFSEKQENKSLTEDKPTKRLKIDTA